MTGVTVTVEAPARLHFGLLDLRGWMGRRFGGIGACAPGVAVRVSVSRAETVEADGDDAERATEFARRFLAYHGLSGGARIVIDRSIPPHSGLGSGTQLALSVARALAELHDVATTPPELARSVGRAKRSAVGTWTFAHGGFVVEGGRRVGDDDAVGPLLARLEFPAGWRCVLAVPRGMSSLSGAAEANAFATLPAPEVEEVRGVAYLVLMAMLPAIADADLELFGTALTEVQEMNGRWFSRAQGGIFAPGPSTEIVRLMRDSGATGVGQSSWGPAVYAVVGGAAAAHALATRVHDAFGDRVEIHTGEFSSRGAIVSQRRS